MSIQAKVQEHYKNRSTETADDHMHIGGKKGTAYFAEKMNFKTGESLLDVGCGLGGPARFVAETYGVSVTGVDLSPDNISSARALSAGLPLRFDMTDGESLPYENDTFDAAMVLHVGMNVPDKAGFYKEISRILKPGGRLGVYDILKTGDSALTYPLPWAQDSSTSFLESAEIIQAYIEGAGLNISYKENRYNFALESLKKILSSIEITMSAERRNLLGNLLENIKEERCSPYIFMAERMK